MKLIEIRANGTKRVATKNDEPSKTDQSFKDEVNVNNIISKFNKTGQISHLAKKQGIYADLSEIQDLLTSRIQVQKAQEAFDSLPAEIRRRFGNSPVELVNFLQDPANDQEAVKLGLKQYESIPQYQRPVQNDDDLNDDDTPPAPKKTKKSNPNPSTPPEPVG